MNEALLNAYHRLPPILRNLASSANGWTLHQRRYGDRSEEWVAQALAREHWTPDQWSQWQKSRLDETLQRAAERVPYYRDYWQKRRKEGKPYHWRSLEDWPVLEKEIVRGRPAELVADDCPPRRLREYSTSGSTGSPLRLWRTAETDRKWYAIVEARLRRWWGLSKDDRWAHIGGRLVVPVKRRKPPFWVWNGAMRQLYMSSYHLAPDLVHHYFEALERYQVRYLLGYTSSLHSLAVAALERGGLKCEITCALANSEPLLPHQRRVIEQAFGCPVIETYGMAELAAGASECAAGRFHAWPDVGVMEVLKGSEPAAPGSMGDLVCTPFTNPDMPLIRYRVGDRGTGIAYEGECECGRSLPTLGMIDGRLDDVLIARDGRKVGRLDPVFKGDLPIVEAQIIQESRSRVRVLVVAASSFTEKHRDSVRRRIRDRMGDIEVDVQLIPEIRRDGRKFRAVIRNFKLEESEVHATAAH